MVHSSKVHHVGKVMAAGFPSQEARGMNLILLATQLAFSILYIPISAQGMALPTIRRVFLLHQYSEAHFPCRCLDDCLLGDSGSCPSDNESDHHNPLIDNGCLLYIDSPPPLFLYAPASHAHFPPLLLTNRLEPDHTAFFTPFLFWLLCFLYLGGEPQHSLGKNIFSSPNEPWPSRSPLKGI